MAVFGVIGEVYLVSAAVGSIYLLTGLVMGHMHGGDAGGHAGGHIGGGPHADAGLAHGHMAAGPHADAGLAHGHVAAGPHADAGLAHGHAAAGPHADAGLAHGHAAAGPHADAGAAHGHTAAGPHADAGAAHGHTAAGAQANSAAGAGQSAAGARSGAPAHINTSHVHVDFAHTTRSHPVTSGQSMVDTGPVQILPRLASKAGSLILTVLSPMTLACFLAFFGITGLILLSVLPALGIWSALPAAFVAGCITRVILNVMSYVVAKMFVTTVAREDELIGQLAEVSVGIEPGGMGQVTYVVGYKRLICPARAAQKNVALKRGTRVIVTDIRDRVVYVEPWTDSLLDLNDQDESVWSGLESKALDQAGEIGEQSSSDQIVESVEASKEKMPEE